MPCILYSAAVFLGVRYAGERLMKNKVFSRVILFLAPTTLASYLFHQYVLNELVKAWHMDTTGLAYRLTFPILLFAMVAIPIHFLKKVPGFSYVLPS